MIYRFTQLYEMMGVADVVQIVVLTLVFFGILRLLSKTGAGSWIGRGVGVVIVALFLIAQIVIANFDLIEFTGFLDYLLAGLLIALLVIFQPELRRGLMMIGRSPIWHASVGRKIPVAEALAEAAIAMSRQGVGALIAIQRDDSLSRFVETGHRIDCPVSSAMLRTIFWPKSPLHDGAVILEMDRIVAASCQLPMRSLDRVATVSTVQKLGMRHRSALSLSEETDAIVLVVSEETGRISVARGGVLEPVPSEILSQKLADELNQTAAVRQVA